MSGFFVTGTDTEVGKTVGTCALLQALAAEGLQVAGMKPLASGCTVNAQGKLENDDVLAHRRASNVLVARELANPYAFVPPISPHLAAQEAGVGIDLSLIESRYAALAAQCDVVLVEGAGGWLAPIDDRRSMADLAAALGLPVILVVGMRLGCLNHAMLTVEAIKARGLQLAGWVANCVDPAMLRPAENLDYLRKRITAPLLGVIPHFSSGEKVQSNQVQILEFDAKALLHK
ncbi:dethiobiotin synthase [Chitinimonas sp.]|uniref:dethiobiotin synthase n=1 Tax=Chitinimonas sp. TaxID=1934313 RepID=UPI0035AF9890